MSRKNKGRWQESAQKGSRSTNNKVAVEEEETTVVVESANMVHETYPSIRTGFYQNTHDNNVISFFNRRKDRINGYEKATGISYYPTLSTLDKPHYKLLKGYEIECQIIQGDNTLVGVVFNFDHACSLLDTALNDWFDTVPPPTNREKMESRFSINADGWGSIVRRAIGYNLDGSPFLDNFEPAFTRNR